MTEEQKLYVKNKLHNWANTTKMISLQNTELTHLRAICREAEASKRLIPEGKPAAACKNVIEACQNRIEQIDRTIKKYRDDKISMDNVVDNLDYTEQIIIRQRYMYNKGWDCILAYLPVPLSTRQCYRIHNEILEKIYDILK